MRTVPVPAPAAPATARTAKHRRATERMSRSTVARTAAAVHSGRMDGTEDDNVVAELIAALERHLQVRAPTRPKARRYSELEHRNLSGERPSAS